MSQFPVSPVLPESLISSTFTVSKTFYIFLMVDYISFEVSLDSIDVVLLDLLKVGVRSAKSCLKMLVGLPVSFLSGRLASPGRQLKPSPATDLVLC